MGGLSSPKEYLKFDKYSQGKYKQPTSNNIIKIRKNLM